MRHGKAERSGHSTTGHTSASCRNNPISVANACGVLLVLVTSSLPACQRSSLSDGLSERQDCSTCHGSSANAAPPQALNGSTNTTDIGVGAHQAHMIAGHVAAPVSCADCHPLPADLLTHPDQDGRAAIVTFGRRASLSNTKPVWNRDAASCSNTYCHGAALSGADQRSAPIWTLVDGSQRACTSCHGYPPGGSHPSSVTCIDCHGAVVGTAGRIKDLSRHIDGNVDFNPPQNDAGMPQVVAPGKLGGTTQQGVP